MTAVAVSLFILSILVVVFLIKMTCDNYDLKAELNGVKNELREFKRQAMREHEFTQNGIAEVEHQLDILVTPIEDRFAEYIKKMYNEINEED